MARKELSVNAQELLETARLVAKERYGHDPEHEYEPLVEMMVYAQDPTLSPNQKFAANKEVAQYLYPKKKAVEHSGEGGGGMQVYLVQFSDGQAVPIAAGQDPAVVDIQQPAGITES